MFNYKTYIDINFNREYKIFMTKPYHNIKILDLTHVLAGPFCTYQFALLGADVIKIEPPDNPDCARGRGPDPAQNSALRGLNYQVQASNKRAMALDLKKARGREIFIKIARTADVLVENYRTGALDDLGLGYEDLKKINPRLIYCSLTGFGTGGPKDGHTAYDNTIQAASGIIEQSSGHKPGVSFVDYAAGYNAAFAISSALHQRQLTGKGTYISSSMLEVAMTMMAPEAAAAAYPLKMPRQKEAGISAYETRDGILMIGAFTPDQNRRMFEMLEGLEYSFDQALKEPDNWEALWESAPIIKAALKEIFKDRTANEWQEIFHAHKLPAEKQVKLAEAIENPQLKSYFHTAKRGAGDTYNPKVPIAAYHFDDGPEISSPAPGFGEHTDLILEEYGVSSDDIDVLRKEGVVA
jgi:crotonobetainyl-CoA:carnitine CoA-transferase CaiB-like acyl-CoA transferase